MSSDRDYYYRRAEMELEQAQRASSAEAVKAHYTLASHYLDRVYDDPASPDMPGRATAAAD